LTKRELVIEVASKLGVTQNEVADIVQTMFDTITETLVEGNRIEIRNFGVFEVKARDARVGRNPRTGEEVPIPEKRVASFKPGKVLKDWVQNRSSVSQSPNGSLPGVSEGTTAPAESSSEQQSA
jgi:integration host factor beta subunit